MNQWCTQDVISWLVDVGLGVYSGQFKASNLTGAQLQQLVEQAQVKDCTKSVPNTAADQVNDSELQEKVSKLDILIPNQLHRKKLIREVRKYLAGLSMSNLDLLSPSSSAKKPYSSARKFPSPRRRLHRSPSQTLCSPQRKLARSPSKIAFGSNTFASPKVRANGGRDAVFFESLRSPKRNKQNRYTLSSPNSHFQNAGRKIMLELSGTDGFRKSILHENDAMNVDCSQSSSSDSDEETNDPNLRYSNFSKISRGHNSSWRVTAAAKASSLRVHGQMAKASVTMLNILRAKNKFLGPLVKQRDKIGRLSDVMTTERLQDMTGKNAPGTPVSNSFVQSRLAFDHEKPRIKGLQRTLSFFDANIPFEEQGDATLYTPKSVESREALRSHPEILSEIEMFWKLLPRDGNDQLHQKTYIDVHIRFQKALKSDFDEKEARRLALKDWIHDMGSKSKKMRMSKSTFFNSVFEIADVWTTKIGCKYYVNFLKSLFCRITIISPRVVWEWGDTFQGQNPNDVVWNKINVEVATELERIHEDVQRRRPKSRSSSKNMFGDISQGPASGSTRDQLDCIIRRSIQGLDDCEFDVSRMLCWAIPSRTRKDGLRGNQRSNRQKLRIRRRVLESTEKHKRINKLKGAASAIGLCYKQVQNIRAIGVVSNMASRTKPAKMKKRSSEVISKEKNKNGKAPKLELQNEIKVEDKKDAKKRRKRTKAMKRREILAARHLVRQREKVRKKREAKEKALEEMKIQSNISNSLDIKDMTMLERQIALENQRHNNAMQQYMQQSDLFPGTKSNNRNGNTKYFNNRRKSLYSQQRGRATTPLRNGNEVSLPAIKSSSPRTSPIKNDIRKSTFASSVSSILHGGNEMPKTNIGRILQEERISTYRPATSPKMSIRDRNGHSSGNGFGNAVSTYADYNRRASTSRRPNKSNPNNVLGYNGTNGIDTHNGNFHRRIFETRVY